MAGNAFQQIIGKNHLCKFDGNEWFRWEACLLIRRVTTKTITNNHLDTLRFQLKGKKPLSLMTVPAAFKRDEVKTYVDFSD